jgi:hypothetical protein
MVFVRQLHGRQFTCSAIISGYIRCMAKNLVAKRRIAATKAPAGAEAVRIGKKTRAAKESVTLQAYVTSAPISAEAFRNAAEAYTVEATKTRDSALETLKRERILTKRGELAKAFS